MSTSRPFFLSFEGIDACGKSTQVKLLLNQMNKSSNNTILVREPGGSIISERIREILLDKNKFNLSASIIVWMDLSEVNEGATTISIFLSTSLFSE